MSLLSRAWLGLVRAAVRAVAALLGLVRAAVLFVHAVAALLGLVRAAVQSVLLLLLWSVQMSLMSRAWLGLVGEAVRAVVTLLGLVRAAVRAVAAWNCSSQLSEEY